MDPWSGVCWSGVPQPVGEEEDLDSTLWTPHCGGAGGCGAGAGALDLEGKGWDGYLGG